MSVINHGLRVLMERDMRLRAGQRAPTVSSDHCDWAAIVYCVTLYNPVAPLYKRRFNMYLMGLVGYGMVTACELLRRVVCVCVH